MPNSEDPSRSAPAAFIRKARRSDLPFLLSMIQELAAYHDEEATVTPADLERDLFDPRPWAFGLVAELDDVIAGYALLCPLYTAQEGRRGMDLHHLFVAQQARGKGLGRLLVEAAENEALALDCRYLVIGVRADNLAAQAFYESLGYTRADSSSLRFRRRLQPTMT